MCFWQHTAWHRHAPHHSRCHSAPVACLMAHSEERALETAEVPQKHTEQHSRLPEEHTVFPNTTSLPTALCLSATSCFWLPRSHTSLGKASSLSHYTIHMVFQKPASRVGTLHPQKPQRLAHLDWYFNLLQLIYFCFSFLLAVWVLRNSTCVLNVASWKLEALIIYSYAHLSAGPAEPTVHLKRLMLTLSKVAYLSFFKCQCLALTGHITLFALNVTHSKQKSHKEPFSLQNINTLKPPVWRPKPIFQLPATL